MTHLVHETSPLNSAGPSEPDEDWHGGRNCPAFPGNALGKSAAGAGSNKKDTAPKRFYLSSGSIELGGHMVTNSGSDPCGPPW